MARLNVSTNTAWEKKAAYSRAVKVGPFIEVAGTTASDGINVFAEGDLAGQTKFIMEKIKTAINQCGASLEDIVRIRVFVRDATQWEQVAKIHYEYFHDIKPVMTLVEATFVHPKILVEIEASAIVESEL